MSPRVTMLRAIRDKFGPIGEPSPRPPPLKASDVPRQRRRRRD
jgi:hypothetical protein